MACLCSVIRSASTWLLVVAATALTLNAAEPAAKLVWVQVVPREGATKVGEFLSENSKQVELLDVISGRTLAFEKDDLIRFEKGVSDDVAAQYIGISAVVARKISPLVPKEFPKGAIIKIDGALIYVRLGKLNGIEKGDKLKVFRGEAEILDPETGEVLGKERRRIADLLVTETQDKLSKARQLGELEVELKAGDTVEPTKFSNSIVVLPPVTQTAKVTKGGVDIAEELTTGLVGKGVNVVERRLLVDALSELALAHSALVDEATAAKVGRLIGAYGVLTGSVAPAGRGQRLNLRLIEVETGKVLFAVGCTLRDSRSDEVVPDSARVPGKAAASPDTPVATVASLPKDAKWISKDATYTVSSVYERAKPLKSLLSEKDEFYFSERGVTASGVSKDGWIAMHTNIEAGAHLKIDLGKPKTVSGIYINNDLDTKAAIARANELAIWVSLELGNKGERVWVAEKALPEFNIAFQKPLKARYITIGFPETKREYLHLKKIKVFGE